MRAMVLVGLFACGSSGKPNVDVDAATADAATADAAVDAEPDATPPTGSYLIGSSGTRLKLSWYETTDGLHRQYAPFEGSMFRDSLRNEACFARAWSDDKLYCTPQVTNPNVNQPIYSDSGCTVQSGTLQQVAYTATYVADCDPQNTPTKISHFYGPSGAAKPAGTLSYFFDGSACRCISSAGGTAGCPLETVNVSVGYALGAELASSAFVELERTYPAEATGRLRPYTWHGVDGSASPASLAYDATLEVDCSIRDERCGLVSTASVFTGPGCSTPTARVPTACPMPTYTGGTNPFIVTTTVNPSCAVGVGFTAYQLGAAVTTAPLNRTIDMSGTARLKVYQIDDGADITHLERMWFYDSVKQTRCGVPDGGGRCLPFGSAGTITSLYTEPTCTTAALVYGRLPPEGLDTYAMSAGTPYAVTQSEHVGNLYYKTSTQCESWMSNFPPTMKWHDLTAVPLTDFQEVTVVND